MGIEEYAQKHIHFYNGNIVDKLLEKYLANVFWMPVLDCGCGDGVLLYILQKNNFLNDKKIYAIDLFKNRIAKVIQNIKNVFARVDNTESTKSISDESVDFFISTQVIKYIDDKAMIKSIERVTITDSIIYLTTIFKKKMGLVFL